RAASSRLAVAEGVAGGWPRRIAGGGTCRPPSQADGRTTDRGGTGIGQGCRSPWLSYRPVDVATCGGDHRAVDRRVVPPWSCVVRPTRPTRLDLAAASPTGDRTER